MQITLLERKVLSECHLSLHMIPEQFNHLLLLDHLRANRILWWFLKPHSICNHLELFSVWGCAMNLSEGPLEVCY